MKSELCTTTKDFDLEDQNTTEAIPQKVYNYSIKKHYLYRDDCFEALSYNDNHYTYKLRLSLINHERILLQTQKLALSSFDDTRIGDGLKCRSYRALN